MPIEYEPQGLRPLVDRRELRALLGISEMTLNRMLRAGILPSYKVSGLWRFDVAEVRAALRMQPGEHWVQPRKRRKVPA
jgi:excisionase family DNA binding protein